MSFKSALLNEGQENRTLFGNSREKSHRKVVNKLQLQRDNYPCDKCGVGLASQTIIEVCSKNPEQ